MAVSNDNTPPRWLDGVASFWQQTVAARLQQTMPGPYPSLTTKLLASIVYGIHAAPLPGIIEDAFRRAGVIHILVVSGTQVALLIAIVLYLGRGLGVPIWVSVPTVVAMIIGYSLLAGANAPVVRAAVMGAVVVLALATRRPIDTTTSLAAAAMFIVWCNGQSLFDAGFQLSFAATVGLFTLADPMRKLFARLGKPLDSIAGMSAAAQIAVAPLIAHYFGRISLVALPANLIAVPGAAMLLGTGCMSSCAAFVCPPAATAINCVNHLLLDMLVRTVAWLGCLPAASVHVPVPGVLQLVGAYAALGLSVCVTRQPGGARETCVRLVSRVSPERALVAFALIVTGLMAWRTSRPAPEMRVTILDVGQGDSIVVESPDHHVMLIDGGTDDLYRGDIGDRVILPFLQQRGVRRLDVLIITHGHTDHVNGLLSVVRELPVGMVLDSGLPAGSPEHALLLQTVRQQGIPLHIARRGTDFELGREVTVQVLYPDDAGLASLDNLNEGSVVTKIAYRHVSALLTGDLEGEGEMRFTAMYPDLPCAFLKIGHHGAGLGTSAALLRAVRPAVCAISVGRHNRYGHPDVNVLQRIADAGARLYVTSRDGAVTFRTDGENYSVSTFLTE